MTPLYQLRARFCGVLDWTCPWCGHLNRSRINRTAWKIQCKAKGCRRRFTIGALIQTMAAGRSLGRKTLPPADVTFPLASYDRWKPGGPVNRFIAEEPSGDDDG